MPWSHQGVLGTAAALASAEEVFQTLKPLLSGRENTEAKSKLAAAGSTGLFAVAAPRRPLPDARPRWATANTSGSNGYVAGALGALQMVPSTLETEPLQSAPEHRRTRMKPIDRRQFLGRSAARARAPARSASASAPRSRPGRRARRRPGEARERALADELAARSRLRRLHQAGILTPRQANAAFVALDAIAPARRTN